MYNISFGAASIYTYKYETWVKGGPPLEEPPSPSTKPPVFFIDNYLNVCEQIRKTQAEPQWIVAQRLLSALTIPGFT